MLVEKLNTFERAAKAYDGGYIKYVPTDAETAQEALGSVPPEAYGRNRSFLMGEPYTHNSDGEEVFAAFVNHESTGWRCALMTALQFKSIFPFRRIK